jgi:hypothetical protein
MAASDVQQTSLGWQLRKLGQYLSEWIELQLSRNQAVSDIDPPPQFELPDWIGQLLLWLSLGIGIGLLTWVLWLLLVRYLDRDDGASRMPRLRIAEAEPELSAAAWLRQAKQWEQSGNWQAACRALYMAALQKLHDRQWIPHLNSRTDGEYLQALDQVAQPRPYQLLIRTHERSEFGETPLTADNLKRCQQAYQEIEKQ